ncbi:hypothetical protein H7Y63_01315 [Polaromonas sp.]|nr:hypothetical protein [Candidatus Saccharibacteria bacterium]
MQKRSNSVWRRRRCTTCAAVFTTHETADYSALWRVSGPKASLMPFSHDKLFLSLYNSLQHRPTALTDASGITDTVISKLMSQAKDGLLQPSQIIQTATVALHRFDTAASVHYQAFHKLR